MSEKKNTEQTAVYRYPAAYARDTGEIEQYRASMQQNVACKRAIESVIRDRFDGMNLDGDAAKLVLDFFGIDRVEYVLANTVQMKDWDGRFSPRNKEWANTITIPEDKDPWGRVHIAVDSHPAILNGFIDLVREERAQIYAQRASALGQLSALKSSQEHKAPAKKPPEASL